MKRLLAAGSGDIYQVCHAFRAGERSRLHNPEFTMVEWYRLGFNLQQIMEETAALIARLLDAQLPVEFITYSDAFLRELDCDALDAPTGELERLCRQYDSPTKPVDGEPTCWFLVATRIGPRLGLGNQPHAVSGFAALAQVDRPIHKPRCDSRSTRRAWSWQTARRTAVREQRACLRRSRAAGTAPTSRYR
jgi:lysyl-tRNA synthetase class 2